MERVSETIVRVVRLGDAEMLRNSCFVRNTVEETVARIEENLRGYAEGEVIPLVAEVEEVVVGHASLRRRCHPLHRHRAELSDVVVSGAHQRRGIARRLIKALQDHAAQTGIAILETSARGGTPAEEVYRRVGFEEYGRLPGGLIETWSEGAVFDEVLLWMAVE